MAATDHLLELLDSEGPRLLRLIAQLTRRVDVADDLLQELFLKLSASSSFAAARDPVAFMVRAAINLSFDWRRSANRTKTIIDLHIDANGIDPLEILIRNEEAERALASLALLPDSIRICMVLRHVEQLEFERIAKLLNKTSHQVRALHAKGIAKLRKLMGSPVRPEVSNG